jgi:hypothetical protein
MNEEPTEPKRQTGSLPIVIWALCAFVPSVVGIAFLNTRDSGPWIGRPLLVLNLACSLLSGFGLLRGRKDMISRIVLASVLAFFLFLLNVAIVVFAGCAKTGPM